MIKVKFFLNVETRQKSLTSIPVKHGDVAPPARTLASASITKLTSEALAAAGVLLVVVPKGVPI